MPSRFFILSAPRTGSTLLVRTLNSIDGICCHGELFLPGQVRGLRDDFDPLTASPAQRQARSEHLLQARNADPAAFLRDALARPQAAVGLKIIYQDFLNSRWQAALRAAIARPDIRFIHLRRRNALRRYVSEQVMHAGGAIHSDMGGGKNRRVAVDISPQAFASRQRQLEQEAEQVLAMLGARPVLDIDYEDLADNLQPTMAGICDFLGIATPAQDVEPGLHKVGQQDLSVAVLNYQDLVDSPLTRPFTRMD
ncbi:sulfotransferase [Seongchinamella sediminis]|uniref:Sulfotransferase n=1 Tax=Seongchinamella sediminis TaxID=2283635 RepID=A0A3L7DYB8_9GAMM|nr:sulfotransferase [Seongchinamella sediminis]RLQ22196.1 sulfotransferase [Seongchinamella sediminis]